MKICRRGVDLALRSRRAVGPYGCGLVFASLLVGCQSSPPGATETDVASSSTTSTTGDSLEGSGTGEPTSGEGSGTESSESGTSGTCGSPKTCAEESEANAAAAMEGLRDDPAALLEFLIELPKGGDLHHHLSGSVYAETYLQWAAEGDDLCLQTSNLSLSFSCGDGNDVPIPSSRRDLYYDVIRAWSMFEFVPTPQESGADHFFATFSKFGAISGNEHGRMLADVRRRAASQNVLYIEPMLTSNSTARSLGESVWQQQGGGPLFAEDYAAFHQALLADQGFPAARAHLVNEAVDNEIIAQTELACDTEQPRAGCEVVTRYQAYISRSGSDEGVFAQMVAAYEAAAAQSRIVGLNLVGPEDGFTAMANYDRLMAMLAYLNGYYGRSGLSPLRLSLHAGEITAASVPDGFLLDETQHIRKAVQIAGASRIGHGVDVMFEGDPDGLLTELRDRGILVEICLASNDIILEVSGPEHPIHEYLAAGVPVALATDDQAVARSSLAQEFFRGVADQGLDYYELKKMIRASLEYSFLPGDSVWANADMLEFTAPCAPAPGDTPVTRPPSDECATFLATHPRAAVERKLELQLEQFEAAY